MSYGIRLTVALPIATALLQLAGCSGNKSEHHKIEPAHVEHIDGSDLGLVILTPRASERLGIETAAVTETKAARTRTVPGEVIAMPVESEMIAGSDMVPAASGMVAGAVGVMVPFDQMSALAADQPARVLPRGYAGGQAVTGQEIGWAARPIGTQAAAVGPALTYQVDGTGHDLVPGQRVRVSLPLTTEQRTVVPYAAIMYDAHGLTWVYTNPEPLHFIRHQVEVDYIDGNLAILSGGPPSGTRVVTVGVAELYGTEYEVGH